MNDFSLIIRRFNDFQGRIYVILRWLMCPFIKMESLLPKNGLIVDIGCGEGILSIYLALKSRYRRVIGIDIDEKRIKKAKQAGYAISNLSFRVKNALDMKSNVDGIVISDVFHHLTKTNQEEFLINSYKKLNNGGILLIKEINKDDKIRAAMSRFWDFIFYPKDMIRYWSRKQLTVRLTNIGFFVESIRETIYFPGSTILYICRKK